jgi:hypothetical protein
MQPPVRVGPSTISLIIAALSAAAGFIADWQQTGNPSPWLGALSAALVAVLGFLRTWQATVLTRGPGEQLDDDALVDELPDEPTDVPMDQQ